MKLIDVLTATEVALPNGLLWEDEFTWAPSVASVGYSLTGALIVQVGEKAKGRNITLKAGSEEEGWVLRSTVELLNSWLLPAGRKMTLVLEYPTDVRTFTVMFRHADGAMESAPVKKFPCHDDSDWFNITLRLLEVNP